MTLHEPGGVVPERKLPRLTQAELLRWEDEYGRSHYAMRGGRRVCGRLKREKNREIPDEACLAPPMRNGACRVHGGRAGPPVRNGRYARSMRRWLQSFHRAGRDAELLDARRDLQAMDVMIERLLERAEDLDTPAWRLELQATYDALQGAIKGKRQAEVSLHMRRLGELIERGADADVAMEQLFEHIERRANRACKVQEVELKREEVLTAAELAAVLGQWLGALRGVLEPVVYLRVLPALRKVTSLETLEIEAGPR